MHHFEKKFPRGPRKNVWGPRENVSLPPSPLWLSMGLSAEWINWKAST